MVCMRFCRPPVPAPTCRSVFARINESDALDSSNAGDRTYALCVVFYQKTLPPVNGVPNSGSCTISWVKLERQGFEVKNRDKIDRERKRRGKRRKATPLGGVARGRCNKGVTVCGMMKVPKPKHQNQRKDAVRNYTTQHVPGTLLNFIQRQTPASDWNAIVNAGCRITLRQFAAKHGLRYETWRREYLRGATGEGVRTQRTGGDT